MICKYTSPCGDIFTLMILSVPHFTETIILVQKKYEHHRCCNYEWFNKWIWPIKSIRQTAETTSIYNLENTTWINLRSKIGDTNVR